MIIKPIREMKTQQEKELEQVKADREILFILFGLSVLANVLLLIVSLTA